MLSPTALRRRLEELRTEAGIALAQSMPQLPLHAYWRMFVTTYGWAAQLLEDVS